MGDKGGEGAPEGRRSGRRLSTSLGVSTGLNDEEQDVVPVPKPRLDLSIFMEEVRRAQYLVKLTVEAWVRNRTGAQPSGEGNMQVRGEAMHLGSQWLGNSGRSRADLDQHVE